MMKLRALAGTARLNFLILTPICVYLGIALAAQQGTVHWPDAVLCLLGALAAHISVNMLNEYSDFRSGLDAMTERTPFSGGSGTLPANPEAAAATLGGGMLTLLLTAGVGIYFLTQTGLALLPLGLIGLAVVGGYTVWITRHPLLCLLAPGIGFGPLMVMGTGVVLSGGYAWPTFTASLTPLFLVSGLLLLNQFPDVAADREAGRRHFPIVLGRRRSAWIFAGLVIGAYVPLVAGVGLGLFPRLTLIGLFPLPAAIVLARAAIRYAEDIPRLVPWLGVNVGVITLTLVLSATGIVLG